LPLSEADLSTRAKAAALDRAFDHLEKRFGRGFRRLGIDLVSTATYLPEIKASGAAVYAYSGWFDGTYQHAAIKRFLTLDSPGDKLIIGPWNHRLQNISPGSPRGASRFDHVGELLKFFDYHLKGVDTGMKRVEQAIDLASVTSLRFAHALRHSGGLGIQAGVSDRA
jgi:putative CocE/NonD family hydrolase